MGGRNIMSGVGLRGVALALFVLAVTLKIIVPAGFMADSTPGASFSLVLCTDQGVVDGSSLATAPDGGERAPDQHHDKTPCAFAGHGAGSLSSEPPSIQYGQVVDYTALSPPARVEAPTTRTLAAAPPPARGPPLRA
jgi:hypothetical protein